MSTSKGTDMPTVVLPNGVRIENVPEGTPKSEIRDKALKANLATREDFPELVEQDSVNSLNMASENGYTIRALDVASASGKWRSGEPLKRRETDFLLNFSSATRTIESNDTVDAVQEEGPGRGAYQYELGEEYGGSNAAATAVKRYRRLYEVSGIPVPEEFEEELKKAETGDSYDFSKLSSDLQDDLFFADKLMGKESIAERAESEWEKEEVLFKIWLADHKRAVKDGDLEEYLQTDIAKRHLERLKAARTASA